MNHEDATPLDIAIEIITVANCQKEYHDIEECATSNNLEPDEVEKIHSRCRRQIDSFAECANKLTPDDIMKHFINQEGCEDEQTKFERCFKSSRNAEKECKPLLENLLNCGSRKFLERLNKSFEDNE